MGRLGLARAQLCTEEHTCTCGTHSYNSLSPCLSVLQETKVPVPHGCPALPIYLSARGQLQVQPSIWGGKEAYCPQKLSSPPKRNISVEGFPLWPPDIIILMMSLWLGMVCCLCLES